jgi:hypothetical protein
VGPREAFSFSEPRLATVRDEGSDGPVAKGEAVSVSKSFEAFGKVHLALNARRLDSVFNRHTRHMILDAH